GGRDPLAGRGAGEAVRELLARGGLLVGCDCLLPPASLALGGRDLPPSPAALEDKAPSSRPSAWRTEHLSRQSPSARPLRRVGGGSRPGSPGSSSADRRGDG